MRRNRAVINALIAAVCTSIASANLADDQSPAKKSPLTFTAGADVVTTYFFRGIPQENEGLIFQPYLNAGYKLYEGTGWLNNLTLQAGAWNSLHTGPTREIGDPEGWYELDLSASIAATIQNDWTLTLGYTAYISPEGAFDTVQEINLNLAYDDSKLLEKFALHPHALVAVEIDNQADAGNSAFVSRGTHQGIYGELGIAPQISLAKNFDLVFPATLGLSIHDYYQDVRGHDSTFGYLDVGAELVCKPLTESMGDWTFHIGPHAILLGDTTADIGRGVTGGDDFLLYFRVGASINF